MEAMGEDVTEEMAIGLLVAVLVALGTFLLRMVVKIYGLLKDLWDWHGGLAARDPVTGAVTWVKSTQELEKRMCLVEKKVGETNENMKKLIVKWDLFVQEWRLRKEKE